MQLKRAHKIATMTRSTSNSGSHLIWRLGDLSFKLDISDLPVGFYATEQHQ
jgi:hypothetical protein